MFYSQQSEDQYLYNKFLNYNNGFFIELGAMDGIVYSNTKFFEDTLGWTGILIEPTVQFNLLNKNRPKCFNFNYAISEIEGEVEFLGDDFALGGMTHTMADKHRAGWHLDRFSPHKVKAIPINKIFDQVKNERKIDKVDLFSIDVEGGELEVLKTFDFSNKVYIVLIEMANHDLEKDQKCRDLLLKNNFLFDSIIGNNEVWVNKNV